jgi:hypothetical protein
MGKWFATVLLAAVVGTSAAAPSASAVSWHSETTPEYLSASQVESTRFKFPSTHFGEFFLEPICKKASIVGKTSTSTSEQVELLPSYSECTSQALAVVIEMNGCGYALTPFASGAEFKSNFKINCPAGKGIVIKFFNFTEVCRIMIGAQTPASSSFTLTDEGLPKHVHLNGTAKGLFYTTQPERNTNCGEATNNAEIVSNLAINGYSDEARTKLVGFWVE